eukprot:6116638-Prymnesium_polylepis.1
MPLQGPWRRLAFERFEPSPAEVTSAKRRERTDKLVCCGRGGAQEKRKHVSQACATSLLVVDRGVFGRVRPPRE